MSMSFFGKWDFCAVQLSSVLQITVCSIVNKSKETSPYIIEHRAVMACPEKNQTPPRQLKEMPSFHIQATNENQVKNLPSPSRIPTTNDCPSIVFSTTETTLNVEVIGQP